MNQIFPFAKLIASNLAVLSPGGRRFAFCIALAFALCSYSQNADAQKRNEHSERVRVKDDEKHRHQDSLHHHKNSSQHQIEHVDFATVDERELVKLIKRRMSESKTHSAKAEIDIQIISKSSAGSSSKEVRLSVDARPKNYWLGVRCEPLPSITKVQLKLDSGLAVHEVVDKSPAAKAGIKVHDILVKLGKFEFDTTRDLVRAVDRTRDQMTSIELMRAGQRLQLEVQPEERPKAKTEQMVLGVFEPSEATSVDLALGDQFKKIEGWIGRGADHIDRNLDLLVVRPGIAFDMQQIKDRPVAIFNPSNSSLQFSHDGQYRALIPSIDPVHVKGNLRDLVHLQFGPVKSDLVHEGHLLPENEVVVFHQTPNDLPHFVFRPVEPDVWVTVSQASPKQQLNHVLVDSLDRKANHVMDHIIKLQGHHRAITQFIAQPTDAREGEVKIRLLQKNRNDIEESIVKLKKHHSKLLRRIESIHFSTSAEFPLFDAPQRLILNGKILPLPDTPPFPKTDLKNGNYPPLEKKQD